MDTLILITNQGRHKRPVRDSHEAVYEIHRHFIQSCADKGIVITNVYHSPHHPDYGESLSRAPRGLMIEKACARYLESIRVLPGWLSTKSATLKPPKTRELAAFLMPVNGDLLDCVPQMLDSHV